LITCLSEQRENLNRHTHTHTLVRYLYLGKGPALGHTLFEASELLVLADEFLVPALRARCEHVVGRQLNAECLPAALDVAAGLRLTTLRAYCELLVSRSVGLCVW
jgi:hypothetical protein